MLRHKHHTFLQFNKNITNIYNYCIKNTKKRQKWTNTYSTNCLCKRRTGKSSQRNLKQTESSPAKCTFLTWHHISNRVAEQLPTTIYLVVFMLVQFVQLIFAKQATRLGVWIFTLKKRSRWSLYLPLQMFIRNCYKKKNKIQTGN